MTVGSQFLYGLGGRLVKEGKGGGARGEFRVRQQKRAEPTEVNSAQHGGEKAQGMVERCLPCGATVPQSTTQSYLETASMLYKKQGICVDLPRESGTGAVGTVVGPGVPLVSAKRQQALFDGREGDLFVFGLGPYPPYR
jgi:hypothetical protein